MELGTVITRGHGREQKQWMPTHSESSVSSTPFSVCGLESGGKADVPDITRDMAVSPTSLYDLEEREKSRQEKNANLN